MNDDANAMPKDEAVSAADDPMAKAKANGYVEPKAPSFRDRVDALISGVAHAMENNAPMTAAMFAEMQALLMGEDTAAAPLGGEAANG